MQVLRQFGSSLLIASISLILIMGGMTTALAEKRISEPPITITETSLPTRVADAPPTATITPAPPGLLPTTTSLPSPTSTATIPTSISCPAPAGWYPYIVQAGDTISNIAARYKIDESDLQNANCLVGKILIPDTQIYVPSMPPLATATALRCGAPYGWIKYTVRIGDTLFSIARNYGTSVNRLQNANCMGTSTNIRAGKAIYVPNVPTRTPHPSQTPTITQTTEPSPTLPIASATATATTSPPTATPTTATPTTVPPTATASDTAEPTDTKPAAETDTPLPSQTFTPEP